MPAEHTLTDAVQFTQLIPPASSSAARTGTYVPLSGTGGEVVLISVGAIAAGGTLNAQVVQATDSLGTGSKNVANAALVAITDTAGNTAGISNSLYAIEFRSTELDLVNNFTFVSVILTAAVAASISGADLIQHRVRSMPVATNLVQRVKI